jgi:hypothetical protein
MKSLIEFLLYTVLAILFYRFAYKKKMDNNVLDKNAYNDIIKRYNNSLNEFNKNENLYYQKCNKNDYTQRIINYDNSIYKGQVFYGIKHGCGIETYYDKKFNEIKYEGIWENNTENGFGILYKNNITILGNKKNNKYDGLIKFQSDLFPNDLFPNDLFPNDLFPNDLFPNTLIKRVDCIFVYGIQKYCFVIFMNNEYNYIPEYYIEKYNFNIAL